MRTRCALAQMGLSSLTKGIVKEDPHALHLQMHALLRVKWAEHQPLVLLVVPRRLSAGRCDWLQPSGCCEVKYFNPRISVIKYSQLQRQITSAFVTHFLMILMMN